MPGEFEDQGRKFITTEPLSKNTEVAEQSVWDAVRSAFADRSCIGYWRYPIFSKVGETRKEPDILIVDREFNLVVIEVRAVKLDQIITITEQQWQFKNFATAEATPYQQAENQLYALLGYCDREPLLRRKVGAKALVALPLMTEEEWHQQKFDQIPNCPPILFKNHLSKAALLERLQKAPFVVAGEALNDEQWERLLLVMGGNPVLRKAPHPIQTTDPKSRSQILKTLHEQLYELDFQQEQIGKAIPPGLQRIRGIAGSGKTVLLCQKAAHMHLKHPDWDIALVFFTRTLYDSVTELVDKWLRRFTNGDVQYHPQTNKKLRVLHAWGGKENPGLYSLICEQHGIRPRRVDDTAEPQPTRALAELCKRICEEVKIYPFLDAILIDEGQDLISDNDLKFQDKQAIYWLAYQALKPCDPEHPEQRRLIWAYDEAQSLDTLKVPTAKELFGENLGRILSQGVQYTGGIKKSEVMRRCYRTPGPILTAAHAIGMGLLRSEGMLAGITRAEEWKAIGYEVTGHFTPGQQITLHRPPHHSPNPLGQLWDNSLLEFETYASREEELTALTEKILSNIANDELKPSRDILIVVLGVGYDAIELENQVAKFLINQGIDIYIPTALKLNELNPKWPNHNPNQFWMEGAITISRVARAKGNEADMVYVVGLEQVARHESEVSLRNQLFVALTRTRGWACLSGVGDYPIYDEIRYVIDCGDTFTFTYKRPGKRDLEEAEEN